MTAVQHMCTLTPAAASSPLFFFSDGFPLQASVLVKLLGALVHATPALHSVRLTTHSLRIGGTVALQEAGASEVAIQLAGRWRSESWKAFIRFSRNFVLGWSRKMIDRAAPTPCLRQL